MPKIVPVKDDQGNSLEVQVPDNFISDKGEVQDPEGFKSIVDSEFAKKYPPKEPSRFGGNRPNSPLSPPIQPTMDKENPPSKWYDPLSSVVNRGVESASAFANKRPITGTSAALEGGYSALSTMLPEARAAAIPKLLLGALGATAGAKGGGYIGRNIDSSASPEQSAELGRLGGDVGGGVGGFLGASPKIEGAVTGAGKGIGEAISGSKGARGLYNMLGPIAPAIGAHYAGLPKPVVGGVAALGLLNPAIRGAQAGMQGKPWLPALFRASVPEAGPIYGPKEGPKTFTPKGYQEPPIKEGETEEVYGRQYAHDVRPRVDGPVQRSMSYPQLEARGQLERGPIRMPGVQTPIPMGGGFPKQITASTPDTPTLGDARYSKLYSPDNPNVLPEPLTPPKKSSSTLQQRLKKSVFKMGEKGREGEKESKPGEGEGRFKKGIMGDERGSFSFKDLPETGKSGKPTKPPDPSHTTPLRNPEGKFLHTEVIPESEVQRRATNEGRSVESHVADNPHYIVKNRTDMMRAVHGAARTKGVNTSPLGLSNMGDKELHQVWLEMKKLPDRIKE